MLARTAYNAWYPALRVNNEIEEIRGAPSRDGRQKTPEAQ